ncbi:hypothetical protein M4578_20720 [Salipiger sp. P9]|uniref:hypothetical protein n=1 Tax=Salipiger pentaromativorans TaxID=2943193 RepID=UPI0021582BBD|nr:hypothetical protein [Salipiger pentaromativorans]MCR8550252.1 hypothetical protein [Salipiger pentaromativorans]
MTQDDAFDDTAFDKALSAALKEEMPVETPPLARAVLTRLAEEEAHPQRAEPLAEVLSHPGPVAAGYGLLLLGAVALGYAALPLLGGEEMVFASALAELLGFAGGL